MVQLTALTYPNFVTVADGDIPLTANTSGYHKGGKIADNYRVIGIYTVPARTKIALGHPRDPVTRYGGLIYVRIDSPTGQIHGKYRIHFADPLYDRVVCMKQWSSHEQDGSALTDKSKNPTAVPEQPWVAEDGHIVLSILPDNVIDTPITVADTDNKILISIIRTACKMRTEE